MKKYPQEYYSYVGEISARILLILADHVPAVEKLKDSKSEALQKDMEKYLITEVHSV